MTIIIIPTENSESYYRKGFVGKLPRTMNRHEATQFKSESYAKKIAKNLNIKYLSKDIRTEGY